MQNYGMLTSDEKKQLENDVKNSGLKMDNIKIEYPSFNEYGSLVTFKIIADIDINLFRLDGGLGTNKVNICAKKSFYVLK